MSELRAEGATSAAGAPTLGLLPPRGVPDWAWALVARADGGRWAIVERDAVGEVVGTAYRLPDDSKGFAPGGRRGLIVHWPLPAYAGSSMDRPIYVCEGASDTAALLGLGLDAVGVPMAGHCGEELSRLLKGRHAVIVADADVRGRSGAGKLAAILGHSCASVRVIEPPEGAKDARAAVLAGAARDAFERLAQAAAPQLADVVAEDGAPVLVRLSDVRPEPVTWLWAGRIALGKLTLLAGDPGLGKSFLTLDVAARVSTGSGWPDRPDETFAPGGVVLLSAEDGVADTIRPRLDAAGADTSRITVLDAIRSVRRGGREVVRAFDLSRDLPGLERAIRSIEGCRLVVIDPVTAYLGGVDSHNNAEVRSLLAPLSTIAERHGVAVLAVTHLNKSTGTPAVYRAMGSLAFAAAARAAWAVVKDRDDPHRRLLLPIKNNIAADAGGLAYRIGPHGVGGGPALDWESAAVELSADDALSGGHGEHRGRPEMDDAARWLREFLGHGPRATADVQREAHNAGHSLATLRRAKAMLGVAARKSAFSGPWEWALPAQAVQAPKKLAEDAHAPTDEHLGDTQAEPSGHPPKVLTSREVSVLGGARPPTDAATGPGQDWGEVGP